MTLATTRIQDKPYGNMSAPWLFYMRYNINVNLRIKWDSGGVCNVTQSDVVSHM